MDTKDPKKNRGFSDFLFLLFRWRKYIFITTCISLALTTGVVLFLPKTYKAITTVVIAPERTGAGMGGLAGLLSGSNTLLSFGARILGGEVTQEDMLLGILNSRTVLSNTITRFDLYRYYKIKNGNLDRAMKRFKKDISCDRNEFGFIEVSVIHRDPKKSAEITNYLVRLADSIHIALNIENARRNREFIEKRYFRNLGELAAAEESLYRFQKDHGVFVVPEQIKVAISTAGDLEAELFKNQVILNALERQLSSHSSLYQEIALRIQAIQERLEKFHRDTHENRSLLIPFDNMPFIEKEYLRRYREVEIQSKLLQLTYTFYEQAKMEEQKNVPTIMILDPAIPPRLKHSPKRAVIVLAVTLVVFIITVLISLRGEMVLSSPPRNPIEQWEQTFFHRLLTFFSFNPRIR